MKRQHSSATTTTTANTRRNYYEILSGFGVKLRETNHVDCEN